MYIAYMFSISYSAGSACNPAPNYLCDQKGKKWPQYFGTGNPHKRLIQFQNPGFGLANAWPLRPSESEAAGENSLVPSLSSLSQALLFKLLIGNIKYKTKIKKK